MSTLTSRAGTRLAVPHAAPAPVWRRGIAAAVLSAAVNALIFAAAVQQRIFPTVRLAPEAGPQMAVELVIVVSVVGALAATGVYAVLRRMGQRPWRRFVTLAVVVLLLSFIVPFLLPGTLAQRLVLNLMHLVVAGAVVALLPRR
jgi:hypothetical protein